MLRDQPEVRGIFVVGGFSLAGHRPQHRRRLRHAEALGRARQGPELRSPASSRAARAARADRGGARGAVPDRRPSAAWAASAASSSSVEDRGGAARCDELPQRDAGAGRPRQRDGPAARHLHRLHRRHAAARRGGGPREGQGARRPARAVFGTLQRLHGQPYVNDFNYANRTYRVYVQAERQFRDSPQDIGALLRAQRAAGEMIPLEALVAVERRRRPRRSSATTTCSARPRSTAAAPGVSARARPGGDGELARADAAPGHGLEWTARPGAEQSGGQTMLIFGLGLLFVFLVLAAQYESFVLPFVVILSVPLAMLGALGLQLLARARQRRVLSGRPCDADRPRRARTRSSSWSSPSSCAQEGPRRRRRRGGRVGCAPS